MRSRRLHTFMRTQSRRASSMCCHGHMNKKMANGNEQVSTGFGRKQGREKREEEGDYETHVDMVLAYLG